MCLITQKLMVSSICFDQTEEKIQQIVMLDSHRFCPLIEGTHRWVVAIASTALSITQPMRLASVSLPQKQKPIRFIQSMSHQLSGTGSGIEDEPPSLQAIHTSRGLPSLQPLIFGSTNNIKLPFQAIRTSRGLQVSYL